MDRHESYMAEAEADRTKMLTEMAKLEKDKREMLVENARIIQENKSLVDQLEDMNHAISESDAQIQSLTTSLESNQLEIRRLTVAASRAAELESQLSRLEAEQALLQEKLANSEMSEKSAVQRRKKAENTLKILQEQLDKMEKESGEEHQKHVELLERMEQNTPGEQLDPNIHKPRGTLVSPSLGRASTGPNVVSHFVRDILQENANLQMSIVELRDMLQNSDEEVRNLREQILIHKPLEQKPDEMSKANVVLPLSEELQHDRPAISQEFHIHHHYHNGIPSSQIKKDRHQLSLHRRKKRCPVFPPTLYESPVKDPSTPKRTGSHTPQGSASSASTALSSLSIQPSSRRNRFSSSPGSPGSAYQPASIFDRVDRGFESSYPTSPESSCVSSPVLKARQRRPSDSPFHSISEMDELSNLQPIPPNSHQPSPLKSMEMQAQTMPSDDVTEQRANSFDAPDKPTRLQRSEGNSQFLDRPKTEAAGLLSASMPAPSVNAVSPQSPYRSIKRSTSRESLISVSGMDIHSTVPSPRDYHKSHFGFYAKKPSRISSAGTIFSSVTPVVSHTNVTASKLFLSSGEDRGRSSVSLLSSLSSGSSATRSNSPVPTRSSINSGTNPTVASKPRLIGKRVGGWVRERFNGTPSTSPRGTQSSGPSEAGDITSLTRSDSGSVRATLARSAPVESRPPGINQKGPIPWLRSPPRAPTSIHATKLDEELLQECLQE